jgi:hypothetical protein
MKWNLHASSRLTYLGNFCPSKSVMEPRNQRYVILICRKLRVAWKVHHTSELICIVQYKRPVTRGQQLLTLFPRETIILLARHVSARESVLTHASVITGHLSSYHHNKTYKTGLLSPILCIVCTRYHLLFIFSVQHLWWNRKEKGTNSSYGVNSKTFPFIGHNFSLNTYEQTCGFVESCPLLWTLKYRQAVFPTNHSVVVRLLEGRINTTANLWYF